MKEYVEILLFSANGVILFKYVSIFLYLIIFGITFLKMEVFLNPLTESIDIKVKKYLANLLLYLNW